jgi:hypothetical protein
VGEELDAKIETSPNISKEERFLFPFWTSFFLISELYCQIWLNLLMDDYHFKYITKIGKKQKEK